ncbi:MAG: hydroxylamine oxidoreductase, partial [bacterium]|nr:hydroxylamine oxidoreductase [bacterium]
PDYTHWHGFYDLSKNFYVEFIPEAEHLLPGVTDEVLSMEEHAWRKGMTKEEIAEMLEYYENRYGEK